MDHLQKRSGANAVRGTGSEPGRTDPAPGEGRGFSPRRGGRRGRRFIRMAVVFFCVLLLLSAVLIRDHLCFAVTVNGETVGTARDRAQAEEILRRTGEKLSAILGYDCGLEAQCRVSVELSDAVDSPEEIEEEILRSVPQVAEKYALVIDGEAVAAVSERGILKEMLDGFLRDYVTEDTTDAGFVQTVEIRYGYVSESLPSDPAEIRALVAPGSESGRGLRVRTEEEQQRTEHFLCATEYQDDASLYEGEREVRTAGEDGERTVTDRVTRINGVETAREELCTDVTKEPVTQVVALGTAPRPAAASSGAYIWPTEGVITSGFGYREVDIGSTYHQGLDIAGEYGQEICAADGGEVLYAGWGDGYGNFVQLLHDNGDITCYGHCAELAVETGDRVAQGQVIAYMGETGVASGVHVHFEIRVDGEPVDPLPYLP